MGIDKAKAISDPGINIELASHLRNAGGFEIKPIEIDRFHRDKNFSFSQFRLFDFFGRKFASLRAEILMWPDYIWQRSFFPIGGLIRCINFFWFNSGGTGMPYCDVSGGYITSIEYFNRDCPPIRFARWWWPLTNARIVEINESPVSQTRSFVGPYQNSNGGNANKGNDSSPLREFSSPLSRAIFVSILLFIA